MRYLFTALFLFCFSPSFSQTYNGPESVEHDSLFNRWLVGNKNNGTVVAVNSTTGTISPFASGIGNGPYGIEILDSVLYCCSGGSVKGYHLATGTQVFSMNLAGSFLNGITTDGTNNLFVTDFTAKKIIRCNPGANSANTMITGMSVTPNGIIYDGANNRCVFVTWGSNAKIMALSLADSTTSVLMNTGLSNIDGITRDQLGNWYLTAWSGNALYRVNPDFSGTPFIVMPGLNSPADIDINAAGDTIGIPNSGSSNNVVFYPLCVNTPPIAGFTSSPAGATVSFTNTSTTNAPVAYNWTFGDGGTSTSASPSHTYTSNGTYEVCLVVTDECGRDTICDSVDVIFTGLENEFVNELKYYPNPAQQQFTAENKSSHSLWVEIHSVTGVLMKTEMLGARSTRVISLAGIPAGICLVSFRDENGSLVKTGRLSIQ